LVDAEAGILIYSLFKKSLISQGKQKKAYATDATMV
jgi:hypothetical protein